MVKPLSLTISRVSVDFKDRAGNSRKIEEEFMHLLGGAPDDAKVSVASRGNRSSGSALCSGSSGAYIAGYSMSPDPEGEPGMALLAVGGLTPIRGPRHRKPAASAC